MSKSQKLFPYKEQALNKDLQELYDWVSRLEYVTTNPDGSRTSKFVGEAVLLSSGGNFYLEVATASKSTVWRGVQLTNTP